MKTVLVLGAVNLMALLDHCTYAWRRGDKYLYVGATSNALGRLSHHNMIGIAEPLQPSDTIEVWTHLDYRLAQAHEIYMIETFEPKYNGEEVDGKYESLRSISVRKCVGCRTEFKPSRWWQKWCNVDCRNGTGKELSLAEYAEATLDEVSQASNAWNQSEEPNSPVQWREP